ncbi:ribbon-helix-helix protein, CopG family [Glaciibacter superstes]|uniref:ribbon-helix-helix protein, CopG family n=1 Tax=Glaciibacter superstes TaxID=501023 RepID=UPI0004210C1E|nr:ribbon-helix-helix protein, CopG family [Glaciibacter superstes]
MASVRLDARQEAALEKLAAETGRTKTYYVKQALDRYLEDRAAHVPAFHQAAR